MATEVTLPALGESVTEGTVTRWLKSVGDEVAVDEPLLEVSTDKVDTEIPSPVAGTLLEIKAEEDETVEVGAVLAMIGESSESGGSDGGGDSGGDEAEAERRAPSRSPRRSPRPEPEPEPEPERRAGARAGAQEEKEPEPAAEEKPSRGLVGGGGGGGGGGTPVTLPALGESVTEGTVTRWLKKVGDDVEVDEPLLEVSTDKVDTEIPSPVAGKLLEIKVEEDETVEVGAELAIVGSGDAAPARGQGAGAGAGEGTGARARAGGREGAGARARAGGQEGAGARARPEAEKEPEPEPETKEPEAAPSRPRRPRPPATTAPATSRRWCASSRPSTVSTWPASPAPASAAGSASRTSSRPPRPPRTPAQATCGRSGDVDRPAGRLGAQRRRRRCAAPRRSSRGCARSSPSGWWTRCRPRPSSPRSSRSTSPTSLGCGTRRRTDFLAREGVKLSYLPFFAKAAIDALKEHPKLNATIDTEAGEVTYFDRENLAFAVDTEKGLLTPVVKDAGDLSIAGLAKKIADVAERTRTNKIGPDELSGGTFTITNLGSVGALWDTPIINKPQVAILGPGTVVKRPVVIDDPNLGETIAVRYMVYLALTYDHRLVDGADAGRFLQDVKKRLEAGQFEV